VTGGSVRWVEPLAGPVRATVRVPGSKSIANRALVCAALADGRSVVTRVAPGDDTVAMRACLHRLGVEVGYEDDTAVVHGTGGRLAPGPQLLHAGLAGTTSRFVTAVAALGPGPYVVDGHPPLRARPMAALHDALAALGASVRRPEAGGLPVELRGGHLTGGELDLPGDVTSQFATALMLVAPLLPGGLRLRLLPPVVSQPYLAVTAAVMGAFGVAATVADHGPGGLLVTVPESPYTPCRYAVEPDASSASYAFALAAVCGGEVTVPGLDGSSLQGDVAFVDTLAAMGCRVHRGADGTTVGRSGPLRGVDVDMREISDTTPTLAAVAAFATTPTRIRGVGFIRHKESDRIGDLAAELRRLGVGVDEHDDGLTVHPARPVRATVATHHDHRLAMALAVVGLGGAGVGIEDPDVVSKSWPGYWDALAAVAAAAPGEPAAPGGAGSEYRAGAS
jgi:3-phosphoshikimate 1-carboxyvinyltransferase